MRGPIPPVRADGSVDLSELVFDNAVWSFEKPQASRPSGPAYASGAVSEELPDVGPRAAEIADEILRDPLR
jgi:hypothetical protein